MDDIINDNRTRPPFLGEYGPGDRVEEGGGAEGELEFLEVREEPLSSLWASTQRGEMTHAKLFMLLHALHIRRPDLFDAETVCSTKFK